MSLRKPETIIIRLPAILTVYILICQVSYSQSPDFKFKRRNHTTSQGYVSASKQSKYIAAGIGVNFQSYFGDLTPNDNYIGNAFKTMRPGLSAFATYNFHPLVFFFGEIAYARITGDDFNSNPYKSSISARKYIRNLSFRNDLFGLNMKAHLNLFRDPYEYFSRKDLNLFLFTGLSVIYSNPKTKVPETDFNGNVFENSGQWVALRPLGTEGQGIDLKRKKYSAIQIGIPVGGGIKWRLSHKLDLMLEGSILFLLTDYIDDVGTNYTDQGIFEDPLARALSDRSREPTAALKSQERDIEFIAENAQLIQYISEYDGNTYLTFDGFGQEGATRGGSRNDLIGSMSIKISYIFTH